jgi:hypothetical protein
MSEQALDLQEALYQLGDVATDPAAAATQLRALLGQLEGQQPGGHQAPGFGPGGTSMVAPEATPAPQLDPFPIDRLDEHVDDVARRVSTMGEQDRQAELHAFVDQLNLSLDVHAQQQAPHHGPAQPASTDEELAALGSEILAAAAEGADADTALTLAERFNATLDEIQGDHLERLDGLEAARVRAERGRQAKAREQDDTAKSLRALAGRLDAGR